MKSQPVYTLVLVLIDVVFAAAIGPLEAAYDTPMTYWINMKSAIERRERTESEYSLFNMPNHRVEGTPKKDITILTNCSESTAHHDNKLLNRKTFAIHLNGTQNLIEKDARIEEFGCLLAHLRAILQAVEVWEHQESSSSSLSSSCVSSKYAIIMEDDNKLVFDVDYPKLISSAPKNFSTLQLKNMNGDFVPSMSWQWRCDSKLWSKKRLHMYSAAFYLINLEHWKPVIRELVHTMPGNSQSSDGLYYDFYISKAWLGLFEEIPTEYTPDFFVYAAFQQNTYSLNLPLTSYMAEAKYSELKNPSVFVSRAVHGVCVILKKIVNSSIPMPPFLSLTTWTTGGGKTVDDLVDFVCSDEDTYSTAENRLFEYDDRLFYRRCDQRKFKKLESKVHSMFLDLAVKEFEVLNNK